MTEAEILEKAVSILKRHHDDTAARQEATYHIAVLADELRVEPDLYNADPKCDHVLIEKMSGVACNKCNGWFCF